MIAAHKSRTPKQYFAPLSATTQVKWGLVFGRGRMETLVCRNVWKVSLDFSKRDLLRAACATGSVIREAQYSIKRVGLDYWPSASGREPTGHLSRS